jgi:hypothetical protein
MGNTPIERELRRQSSTTFRQAQQASQQGDFNLSRKLFTASEMYEEALAAIELRNEEHKC